jgi:hypothetical protein
MKKYLSPWRKILEPSEVAGCLGNWFVARREQLGGKLKLIITYSDITGNYYGATGINKTLDDAIFYYDEYLIKNGWTLLTEERFEKLKILL